MIYKKKQQHGIKRTTMRTPVKIEVEPMCSRKVSGPALCGTPRVTRVISNDISLELDER